MALSVVYTLVLSAVTTELMESVYRTDILHTSASVSVG